MAYSSIFTVYESVQIPPVVSKEMEETYNQYLSLIDQLDNTQLPTTPMSNLDDYEFPENFFESKIENPFPKDEEQLPESPISKVFSDMISVEKQDSKQPKTALKGSDGFEKAFSEAAKINPGVLKYKNFLTKIAAKESSFNSSIQNKAGAPYYGYFQMGKSEIKSTTGLTVEQFRNDPVRQILGAAKLYENYISTVKRLGVYELCKAKGYSDDAIAAGAWLGGAGGVKKFIQGHGDPNDSHWYGGKNKGGTSVGTRMREFNT